MGTKLLSEATAKKLAFVGLAGLVAVLILSFITLLSLGSKINDCLAGANSCSGDAAVEQTAAKLISALMRISLVVIAISAIMRIVIRITTKRPKG